MRVSVGASDGWRSYRLVPHRVREDRLLPDGGCHRRALPETPQGAPSLFRSLGEAAAPCFRKRLDPRMGSKGAQQITDMVTDGFAA